MKTLLEQLYVHGDNQWYSLQDDEGNTKMQKQNNGVALTLTDEIINKHLAGDLTICLQPIQFGSNNTKYGVIDFDADDTTQNCLLLALNDALIIKRVAEKNGVPAYISYSGRRGWHLNVFSEAPVPAGIMRKALMALAKQANYKAKEIYPSSDYISVNYYPRPVKLTPGKHKLGSWAGFVIPEKIAWVNGRPRLPNQEKFLEKVKKAEISKLLELAQQIEDRPELNFKDVLVDWANLKQEHPPCIEYLITKGAPLSLDYNRANMTIVRYGLNRRLPESVVKELGHKMAMSTVDHPSLKDTLEKRMQNLMSSLWSMRKRPEKHQWVCAFMRANADLRNLCSGCKLNAVGSQQTISPDNKQKVNQEKEQKQRFVSKPILPSPALVVVETISDAETILSVLIKNSFIGLSKTVDRNGRVFIGLTTQYKKVYIFDLFKIGQISIFKEILQSSSLIKIMYDSKPLLKFFYSEGIPVGNLMDVMLLGQLLLAGEEKQPSSLDEYVINFLGYAFPNRKEDQVDFENIFATKCYSIVLLAQIFYDKVKDAGLQQVAMLECACVKTLAQMEINGILFDRKKLIYAEAEIKAKLKALRDSLRSSLSYDLQPIDLGSTDDIKTALGKKGIKVTSTKEAVLRPFAEKYPFVKDLIDYRKYMTLSSTYNTGLLKFINPVNERIFTNFKQLVTSTGRIVSEQPCTQNWPTGEFRKLIIAATGNVLLSADYAQIQMAILAEVSQDPKLLEIFLNGQDIHLITASELLKKPVNEITSEERSKIKAVNYGLVFDMQPRGLVQYAKSRYGVNLTEKEAIQYRHNYFELYQGVREWREYVKIDSLANHGSRTIGNRRRSFNARKYVIATDKADILVSALSKYSISTEVANEKITITVPDYLHSELEQLLVKENLKYNCDYIVPRDSQLYNSPIQGTEADIVKLALIKTERSITPFNGMLVNYAYDEILFELPTEHLDSIVPIIEKEMIQAAAQYLKTVPVAVTIRTGATWSMK